LLENLTKGFKSATERFRGVRELSEDNVDEALRDVRMSLLEADVDFGVVKDFLSKVKDRSLGEKVRTQTKDARGRKVRVSPGQHFVAICEQELTDLMGPVDPSLEKSDGLVSVMLIGLQGVGKTTVAAKLANHMKKRGRRPLLVAADVYRPAAVKQLQTLGESIGIPVYAGGEGDLPPQICRDAAKKAKNDGRDAILYDTAGRLAIDDELMSELEQIVESVEPANTLLVCDALMGRDAVNVAEAFKQRLALDGVVLTKLDGDARGGAALAVKAVTGVPIKFIGTGEAVDRLEEFRPEGLASRILGMGDIVGLVQDFEAVVDEKQAEEDAERILKGKFTLDDLVTQLKTIQKLGPLREVFAKMPGMGGFADQVDEKELVKVKAMIGSMTPAERRGPDIVEKSRAERIARGSGRKPKEVHDLINRFEQMRALMQQLGSGGGGGLLSKIPGMGGGMPGNLAGAMPGGMGGLNPGMMGEGAGGGQTRARDADSKKKKKRKQQKKSRQKGRKR
jgi:signal recognition particle subunit SRP54